MAEPLCWRLLYADDRVVEDLTGNESIRLAPRGAMELHVVDHLGNPVVRVPLDLRRGERPVFYRVRSMGLNLTSGGIDSTLDATVFGRVRESVTDAFDGTLWAGIGGRIVDCPHDERHIDLTMIEAQRAGV